MIIIRGYCSNYKIYTFREGNIFHNRNDYVKTNYVFCFPQCKGSKTVNKNDLKDHLSRNKWHEL